MSHAVMPLADYVGACDAIREKTGGTEPIKSGELVEQIGAVHTAGKLAALESAEVLKGNLFGNPVTATAVTPITHNTGARLESKNLIDISDWKAVGGTINGITYTQQADGQIHISGTIADNTFSPTYRSGDIPTDKKYKYKLEPGVYSVKRFWLGGYDIEFYVGLRDFNGSHVTNISDENTKITKECYIYCWGVFVHNRITDALDLTIPTQVEHGTVATPYTPYVSDFTKVRTRNLFNEELYTDYSHSDDGITVDYEGSGIFHVHGSATESGFSTKNLYFAIPVSEGDTFTESVEYLSGSTEIPMYMFFGTSATKGNASNWMNCQINASTVVGNTVTRTSTIPSGANYITAFWFYTTASSGAVDIRVRVQLEEGTEATPYVSYTIPAQVKKRGTNILNADELVSDCFAKNEDESLTFTMGGSNQYEGNRFSSRANVWVPKGTLYSLNRIEENSSLENPIVWRLFYSDGTNTTIPNDQYMRTSEKDIIGIDIFGANAEPFGNSVTLRNIKLNLYQWYDYEPYIPPITYPADAEGNLGEVPSISPTMILECPDAEGVNIVAHYLKDIDGAFEERLADLEAAIVENA